MRNIFFIPERGSGVTITGLKGRKNRLTSRESNPSKTPSFAYTSVRFSIQQEDKGAIYAETSLIYIFLWADSPFFVYIHFLCNAVINVLAIRSVSTYV